MGNEPTLNSFLSDGHPESHGGRERVLGWALGGILEEGVEEIHADGEGGDGGRPHGTLPSRPLS